MGISEGRALSLWGSLRSFFCWEGWAVRVDSYTQSLCCSCRYTKCRALSWGGQLKGLVAGTVGVLVCGVIPASTQERVTLQWY